ncbi:molybdate ABC transporter substrate-binding protein [Rohdeia mirabilis]|uniref:molybdate ABC transporter substrate-binding protein n=1 Tax=Rohdeia mirabilis TaxID=2528008 RepID=UPI003AF37F00
MTRELAALFEARADGAPVELSIGSTGGLYAQIRNGAEFDLFLAADAERPRLLVDEGLGQESRTYAMGRLALVGALDEAWDAALVGGVGDAARDGESEGRATLIAILQAPGVQHVAIANPATAPYGAAALEVLERLGLRSELEPRLVQGADVGQTHHFVATGAAELGFVSLAQARAREGEPLFEIPADLFTELRQDAVLLDDSPGARAFFDHLGSDDARRVLEGAGFGLPSDG